MDGLGSRKRRYPNHYGQNLPEHYFVVLEEAKKNDYISEWGRCCVAGTAKSDSPMLTTKNKCYVDLQRIKNLTLHFLDAPHLTAVSVADNTNGLIAVEILAHL